MNELQLIREEIINLSELSLTEIKDGKIVSIDPVDLNDYEQRYRFMQRWSSLRSWVSRQKKDINNLKSDRKNHLERIKQELYIKWSKEDNAPSNDRDRNAIIYQKQQEFLHSDDNKSLRNLDRSYEWVNNLAAMLDYTMSAVRRILKDGDARDDALDPDKDEE